MAENSDEENLANTTNSQLKDPAEENSLTTDTATFNPNEETENMELHHLHHPTHKKNWYEYILEFLMLFAAVTLGFFAENYREHSIIENRIQENYAAIILDLKYDNQKIDTIFAEARAVSNLIALSNVLYNYKTGTFSENELIDSIYNINTFPSYSTLFINNSTFKNMQSSGLLSYITNLSLKTGLSFYYEVLFKQINDNNKIFDDVGMNYFDNYIGYTRGSGPRRLYSKLYEDSNYVNEFIDGKLYKRFLIQLKSSKAILTSEEFISATNVYFARYVVYQGLLSKVKTENNKLIKLLESQLED